MSVVVEYAPAKTAAETEKMIDELRTLGLQDLMAEMVAAGDKKKK